MTRKHYKILNYIKKHPGCSTSMINQRYKRNVDVLILDLIESEYCRGITIGTFANPHAYMDLTITMKGYEALNWINRIPIIRNIIGLYKDLKK